MINKFILILFFMSVMTPFCRCQQASPVVPDHMERYRSDEGFRYMENIDSLLRAKRREELAMKVNKDKNISETNVQGGFMSSGGTVWFFRILAVLFMAVLLAVLVWHLPSFLKKKPRLNYELDEPEEVRKYSDTELIQRIQNAETSHNLAGAVRWTYLLALKTLSRKNYIQFADAKTNAAYIGELDGPQGDQFNQLTSIYESVWFGKKIPTPEGYARIKDKFQSFMNAL